MKNNTPNGIMIGKGESLPREEALRGILAFGAGPAVTEGLIWPNARAAAEAGGRSVLVLGDDTGILAANLPGAIEVEHGVAAGFDFAEMRRRPMIVVLRPRGQRENAAAFAEAIAQLLGAGGDAGVPVDIYIDHHRTARVPELPAKMTLFRGLDICLIVSAPRPSELEHGYGPGEYRTLLQNLHTVLLHGKPGVAVADQLRRQIVAPEQQWPKVEEDEILLINPPQGRIEVLRSLSRRSWFGSLKETVFAG